MDNGDIVTEWKIFNGTKNKHNQSININLQNTAMFFFNLSTSCTLDIPALIVQLTLIGEKFKFSICISTYFDYNNKNCTTKTVELFIYMYTDLLCSTLLNSTSPSDFLILNFH
jgi:hypothetical protein